MKRRIPIGDGSEWFLPTEAIQFAEHTYWDGSNHISVVTGSQWDHEELCYTRKGSWILSTWSQRQGHAHAYSKITLEQAATWLLLNEHDEESLSRLPEDVRKSLQDCQCSREV